MELIDALHLRGWRPFLLAVVVAIGAIVGALLPQDPSYTSDHILFASQLADDSLSPAQIEDFADELRLAATLPQVKDAVEAQVGGNYAVAVSATASDTSIRFSAEGPTEDDARNASQLTAVEAANFVIGQSIARSQSLSESLAEQLQGVTDQQAEITTQAGGISPPDAVDTASELLFVARQEADNGDAGAEALIPDLEAEIAALRPLEIAYVQLEQESSQITSELSQALTDISQAQNALASVTSEQIIAEVSTKPKSTVPATVQNMLLFAAINAFLLVMIFILIDRFTGVESARADNDDSGVDHTMAGAMDAGAMAAGATAADGAVRFGRRASDAVLPVESLAQTETPQVPVVAVAEQESVSASAGDIPTEDAPSQEADSKVIDLDENVNSGGTSDPSDDDDPAKESSDSSSSTSETRPSPDTEAGGDSTADTEFDEDAEAEAVALANTSSPSKSTNPRNTKTGNRPNNKSANRSSSKNRNKGNRR